MHLLLQFLGGGVVVASSASANGATVCASGYVCVFNQLNAAGGTRSGFIYGVSNYSGMKYASNSSVNLDNSIESVNYNWNTSRVEFWTGANYTGTLITTYRPGEQGFRNWSSPNRNVASSHKEVF